MRLQTQLDPISAAVLAAFTGGLVPVDSMSMFQIAVAVGRNFSDPDLKWALRDLEERGLLHRHGDRRWHLEPRVTRNAIFEEDR